MPMLPSFGLDRVKEISRPNVTKRGLQHVKPPDAPDQSPAPAKIMRSITGIEASFSKLRIQVIWGVGISNRAVDVAVTPLVVALIAKPSATDTELWPNH